MNELIIALIQGGFSIVLAFVTFLLGRRHKEIEIKEKKADIIEILSNRIDKLEEGRDRDHKQIVGLQNDLSEVKQDNLEKGELIKKLEIVVNKLSVGLPPKGYVKVYWLLHNNISEEKFISIAKKALKEKRTIGFNKVDAGIGRLIDIKVVAFCFPDDEKDALVSYFATSFPNVEVIFRNG